MADEITQSEYEDFLSAVKKNRDTYAANLSAEGKDPDKRLKDANNAIALLDGWDKDGLRDKAYLLMSADLLTYTIMAATDSIQKAINKLNLTAQTLNTAAQVLDALAELAEAILGLKG